jgi:uncharacterized membrane-anchored protein
MLSQISALIIVGAVILVIIWATRTTEEQRASLLWGPINSIMICPHCQTKGSVRTKQITRKAGVSGGKATAAILTGGLSILGVGLSRKEQRTEAHCGHCDATWQF